MILSAILDNDTVTISEMADIVGATQRTVQRYLQELQSAHILIREGGDKGGKWVINK